jgi:hypothetical protein
LLPYRQSMEANSFGQGFSTETVSQVVPFHAI